MDSWQYQPATDLDQSLIERLRRFPREPDMLIYGLRVTSAMLLRSWLRTYHRFQIVGAQHLPATGSFVMVANHASHLDALCLLSALPLVRLHRAFPAAAADYFFVSRPRLAAAVMFINAFPFHREIHVRQSLSLCRELLRGDGNDLGNVLILFPEGSRSLTGEVGPFKPGIGSLLAGTPVPVIPCHLSGCAAALPKGSRFPRPRVIRLTIDQPLTFDSFPRGKMAATQIAEELRCRVMRLGCEPGGEDFNLP
jgi:1-acyl-sn-glycerol-3-phosphate acyltransferase